jgi:hypothetical protein
MQFHQARQFQMDEMNYKAIWPDRERHDKAWNTSNNRGAKTHGII